MQELTTNLSSDQAYTDDNTISDQAGASRPIFHALDHLTLAQWTEPADDEPIGPCDDDAQWWSQHSPKDDVEPASWEPAPVSDNGCDLPSDEAMEAEAESFAYHLALEVYQPRPGRLTAEDIQTATGCF